MTNSSESPAESSRESSERRRILIDRLTDSDTQTASVKRRVHIATLRAQLDKIGTEREQLETQTDDLEAEREQLEAEVRSLEARVSELEGRCAVLERAIDYKDNQRQQVIDNYERQLAERTNGGEPTD